MESKCLGVFQICRSRFTILDENGVPETGVGSHFVSDQSVSLAVTEESQPATRRNVTTGCDCIVATDAGKTRVLGYNLELVNGTWAAALEAILTGATPLYDTTDPDTIIGINYGLDSILGCGTDRLAVAFEAWVKLYDGANQDVLQPWMHLVFPWTEWSNSPSTYSVEFNLPGFGAVVKSNSEWGAGPYDDVPDDGTSPVLIDFYAKFATALEPPDASCGLLTAA